MRLSLTSLILASALLLASSAVGQPKEHTAEAAIRQAAKAYLEALSRGDASTVAKYWTKDGVFTDGTGRSQPAHEVIRTEYGATTAATGRPEITIDSSEIRFITPDVAIEDGTSTLKASETSPPAEGRYTAIWVRKEGKWLLHDLRESPLDSSTQAGPLEPLGWMIGEWTSRSNDPQVRLLTTWSDNKKYILQHVTIREEGQNILNAVQRIAWDPAARRIRSWVFDSEGAFVEAVWNQEGDAWIVSASGVRADGTQATSVDFWVPEGKDRFAFKATNPLLAKDPVESRVIEFLRVRD